DPSQVKQGEQAAIGKFGVLPPQIEYRREDALQLSFDDNTFDFVLGTLCFHHVEDHRQDFIKTPQAFQQIHRVLKLGGIFIYWDRWNKPRVDDFFLQLGYHVLMSQKRKGIYQKPRD
ncbi:MAG TPA: class I SAM-dependent methyltransferase, partial [Candidatus Lokiarchaeia archaeon]|nr:class I SAM-dependent methyltransferase [Candidatus Lokiarchaeia archaeon]